MKSIMYAAIGGLALLGGATAAQAAPIQIFGYDLNASIRAQVAPNYEGSKTYNVFPNGSVALTKPWDFASFAAPDDAASIAIFHNKIIDFGGALSVRENRGNSGVLAGMRNIGYGVQTGGYVNLWPTKWTRLHIEALKGVTAQSGLVINGGADFVYQTKLWTLSAGPRFSWADGKYNGTYFGVTSAEAQASPYIINPFTAHSGPHYAGVEGVAEYEFRRGWRLTADASYHRLLSDDANSPLVRQLGKVDQLSASVGIRFLFGEL